MGSLSLESHGEKFFSGGTVLRPANTLEKIPLLAEYERITGNMTRTPGFIFQAGFRPSKARAR
jgi:hypothetical protein